MRLANSMGIKSWGLSVSKPLFTRAETSIVSPEVLALSLSLTLTAILIHAPQVVNVPYPPTPELVDMPYLWLHSICNMIQELISLLLGSQDSVFCFQVIRPLRVFIIVIFLILLLLLHSLLSAVSSMRPKTEN